MKRWSKMWRRSDITKTAQSFKNCTQRHWLTNSQFYYSFLEKGELNVCYYAHKTTDI